MPFNSETGLRAQKIKGGKHSWIARLQKHGLAYYQDRIRRMNEVNPRLKRNQHVENCESEAKSHNASEPESEIKE